MIMMNEEAKKSVMAKIKGMGNDIKAKAANEALKNIKIGGKPLDVFINEFFTRLRNIEKIQLAIATQAGGMAVEYDKSGNITAAIINGKRLEFQ